MISSCRWNRLRECVVKGYNSVKTQIRPSDLPKSPFRYYMYYDPYFTPVCVLTFGLGGAALAFSPNDDLPHQKPYFVRDQLATPPKFYPISAEAQHRELELQDAMITAGLVNDLLPCPKLRKDPHIIYKPVY